MNPYRWHEQPGLENLYESEVGTLKRGLGGDFELLQDPDPTKNSGIVSVIGKLKYATNQWQNVRIIFPTKYPRTPPSVIPVDLQSDKNGKIESTQKHLFGKGNQYNSSGAMCLFKKEEWDSEEDSIGWVLRRAQEWLKFAHSKEGFPKDKIVNEEPYFMVPSGHVILPKDFDIPEDSKSGQITLTQFKSNGFILEQNVIPESPFLALNRIVFDWYSFNSGVLLKDIFPKGDFSNMPNLFTQKFSKNPLASSTNIALYLPDESTPWHFFIFSGGRPNYLPAKNIERELYLRTKDIFDDKILKEKKVTIIGLGALGSEVAVSLARNGVGHFNLFDHDVFEIGNSVRHAADLFYIGENKVNVVKQLILRSNPNITVNSYVNDVLNDNGLLEESLSKSDLCIVLTGEDSVDYMMNDIYVPNFEIPFIFAGVSAGGMSGAIQIVKYKTSPCLRCLQIKKADKLPKPKSRVEFNEVSPEFGSCSSPALPGSEIDTKEVALQISRVVLQELLAEEDASYPKGKGSQLFWHGPSGSKNGDPFEWDIKNLKRAKSCRICGS